MLIDEKVNVLIVKKDWKIEFIDEEYYVCCEVGIE